MKLVITLLTSLVTAAVLTFGAWAGAGDGVIFRIVVVDEGHEAEVFSRPMNPHAVVVDQKWSPVDVDLAKYAGKRIELVFIVDPSLPGRSPIFSLRLSSTSVWEFTAATSRDRYWLCLKLTRLLRQPVSSPVTKC